MTFHHLWDISVLLGHIAAVLKPGGLCCITDLDKEGEKFHEDNTGVFHNGFARAVLKRGFETAGFGHVRNRTAAIIRKPDRSGNKRYFTVFLMTGRVPDSAGVKSTGE